MTNFLQGIEKEEEKRAEIIKLIQSLPMYNKYLLQYLIQLLVKISANSQTNKMGPSNLSIVFGKFRSISYFNLSDLGPNILHKKSSDPYDTADFGSVYQTVQYFIDNYDQL